MAKYDRGEDNYISMERVNPNWYALKYRLGRAVSSIVYGTDNKGLHFCTVYGFSRGKGLEYQPIKHDLVSNASFQRILRLAQVPGAARRGNDLDGEITFSHWPEQLAFAQRCDICCLEDKIAAFTYQDERGRVNGTWRCKQHAWYKDNQVDGDGNLWHRLPNNLVVKALGLWIEWLPVSQRPF